MRRRDASATRRDCMGGFALAAIAALALVLTSAGEAASKDCGGAVACACGDRVVASVTLSGDLNGCDAGGLVLATGVLDCAGRQLSGPGDRTETVGIKVSGPSGNGAQGATVKNCNVRNFGRGIELRGGGGNTISANTIFDNEIGIWFSAASSGNTIEDNYVHDNRDEGIHIGSGATGNVVAENAFVNNRTENVYLLGSSGNVVRNNTLDGAKAAAIFVKNASRNVFLENEILDRNVVLRGDADENVFVANELEDGYFTLSADEETDGNWRYPNGNRVTGGRIIKAGTCFELAGAYDTIASEVVVGTCQAKQEIEAGGVVPYGNEIAVIREDLGNPTSGQRRTGRLRFAANDAFPDRFRLDIRNVALPTLVDPTTVEIGCELTDGRGSSVLSFTVPAGMLEPRDDGGRFIDPSDTYGVTRLDVNRTDAGVWQLRVSGRGALGDVGLPAMELDCHLGSATFGFNDLWSAQARGWRLRVQP